MKIEMTNVSFSYGSMRNEHIWGLEHFSVSITEGQVVALLGPSGCGKTTILKLMGGLLAPTAGKVIVGCEDPVNVRKNIGYVFQSPRLLPWKTVISNIALPLELEKRTKGNNDHVESLLERVGLSGYEKAYPNQLSQGMAHRVALARSLVKNPNILLLDEPFASLDVATRQVMQDLVCELLRELKFSIVMVTHDLTEAVYLCERVLIIGNQNCNIQYDCMVGSPPGEMPKDLSIIRRLKDAIRSEYQRTDQDIMNTTPVKY